MRRGRPVATARIPGRLLAPALPHDLILSAIDESDYIVVEPPERSLAGRLTLPFVSSAGTFALFDFDVPSSGNFTQEDLDKLWQAGRELAEWRARKAQASKAADYAEATVVGMAAVLGDWHSLARCSDDARVLLASWPRRLSRREVWLPLSMPGGIENVERTELEAERRGFATADRGVTMTSRWVGTSEFVKSPTVATMAQTVLELVHSTVSSSDLPNLAPVLVPIRMVATRSAAPSHHRDPDPSSWPQGFVAFVSSCIRVISELTATRRGSGARPFLDTFELYEAWLAIEVKQIIDEIHEDWGAASDAFASWAHDDIVYELWIKPALSAMPRRLGSEDFIAVIADVLRPDLIISATRDHHTELAVLDAKAWSGMLPEDALTQSAKYLWAIRSASDPHRVPTACAVDLVTSALRPALQNQALGMIEVTSATPTRGAATLGVRIRSLINHLESRIIDRERESSSY